MYTIAALGDMIADRLRTEAYAAALRATVRRGDVVLDIGTGTGILALLACQSGASRVIAVEPSEAIQVARETARANGFQGTIEFLQGRSDELKLDRKADVIVSDLHGVLPPLRRNLLDIADARVRLLAPGGRLVPRTESLWSSVVEAPGLWRGHMGPWRKRPRGLDIGAGNRCAVNSWRKARFRGRQVLTAPRRWARIDYRKVAEARVEGRLRAPVARRGVGHGLAVWFDADLAPGVGFSNAPDRPPLIYGQAFFPWPEPVALDKGDVVSVRLRADLVGEDYVWTWESSVRRQGQRARTAVDFRQSTFLGNPLTPETLVRRASTHRAKLGRDGLLTRIALELMDGKTPLGEIASALESRFPGRFPSSADALTFVADLSGRFGE